MHCTAQTLRRPWCWHQHPHPAISCFLVLPSHVHHHYYTITQTQALTSVHSVTATTASDASLAAAEAHLRGTGGGLVPSSDFSIFLADDFDAYPLGTLVKNGPPYQPPWVCRRGSQRGRRPQGHQMYDRPGGAWQDGVPVAAAQLHRHAAAQHHRHALLCLEPGFLRPLPLFPRGGTHRARPALERYSIDGLRAGHAERELAEEAEDGTKAKAEEATAAASYRTAYRFGGQLAIDAGNQLMTNLDTPDFYGGKGPGTDCWAQGDGAVIPAGR